MYIAWRIAASLVWLMAGALLLVKTNRSAGILYRWQALGEAALAIILSLKTQDNWLWITVAAIIIVKVAVVPEILNFRQTLLRDDYGARGPVGVTSLVLVIAALTIAGIAIGAFPGLIHPVTMGVLFGAWLIALVHGSTRYETWSMAWGLLSLDTVSSSLVLALGSTLPPVADLLITMTAVALAVLLALFSRRIAHLKQTTDVRALKELTD